MTREAAAGAIAARYGRIPAVTAVALSGSASFGTADDGSDIDLYVYATAEVELADRAAVAGESAVHAELDNRFWEPGDEWVEASGLRVDVMFRRTDWIEAQLDRVLVRHDASVGYSTCFWHNVATSTVLFDRNGWFERLQARARGPYPEPLRRAIIAKNYPILRNTESSYRYQVERAVGREDIVSVNHRIAAFLASWFDVLFAINRMPHPGEKRLVSIAESRCRLVAAGMREDIDRLFASLCDEREQLVACMDRLVDGLDVLLRDEQLLPVVAPPAASPVP